MKKDSLDNIKLNAFTKAATKGYKIAKVQHEKLSETIGNAKKQIQETLTVFNKSKYMDSSVTDSLGEQLVEISKSFENLEIKTNEEILSLKESLSLFSITLFGRTMAGKSTLMEFLTHGNGDSIGKGSQRTTRDVRTYTWNSLSITDVPGIGAFEGQEDEAVAFNAAKSGDVILFLITDDALQYAEAECFSKIVSLGKPIIVILNIKSAIPESGSLKLALRDIEKKFDEKRIENLKIQFCSFATHFGQKWNHIPIIPVHLQSAYFSQKNSDIEIKSQLYEISRIDFLQKEIINSVRQNGEFYRIKNFIDIIDNPMLSSMETLLEHCNKNSSQARVLLEKKRNLERWKEKFHKESLNKIKTFVTTVKSDLYGEIANFSEKHYEDKNASEEWKKVSLEYITPKSKELEDTIDSICKDHLSEISREIPNALEFSNYVVEDKSINMRKIVDVKRIWDWTTKVLGDGLVITGFITKAIGIVSGPIGLVASAVFGIGILGSHLFSDKNKKINEARQKLESKLKANVDANCKKNEGNLQKWLDEIEEKRINLLCKEIRRILNVMFSLCDEQKKLAWNINHRILDVNRDILQSALQLTGFDGMQYHVKDVARIPGQSILLKIPDGTRFPDDCVNKVQELMKEEVSFVFETDNRWILLSRILGKQVDRRNIRIEEKIGVAHVPIDKKNLFLIMRARLAQQLTELLITR